MASIRLKILLPFRVFADIQNVMSVSVETKEGSYGFLPARLDCVAALIPGILTYAVDSKKPCYIAIDSGILVKAGFNMLLSARNAIAGQDLAKLGEYVKKEFTLQNEGEAKLREVMMKLESGFLYRFDKIKKD